MDATRDHRPLARHDDLVISALDDDVLIYDQRSYQLHQLDARAAAIWHRCTGEHAVEDIARLASIDLGERLTTESVLLALRQLSEVDLLHTPLDSSVVVAAVSRRSLLRKAAISGAVAAPVILSISTPTAAQSISCPSGTITCGDVCCPLDQECIFGTCQLGESGGDGGSGGIIVGPGGSGGGGAGGSGGIGGDGGTGGSGGIGGDGGTGGSGGNGGDGGSGGIIFGPGDGGDGGAGGSGGTGGDGGN